MIASQHPQLVVGPHHRSYWAVMCLQHEYSKDKTKKSETKGGISKELNVPVK